MGFVGVVGANGGGSNFAEVMGGGEVVLGGHFILDVVGCDL